MASWDELGNLSNIVQVTGLDAVRIIGLTVKSANNARMHKKNCLQFANHLKLIGNLLEQLKISELKRYPETREPLEQLEDALRRSFVLVDSCQKRSYLYLLAMGWNIVYQFKLAQSEVDRYLKIIPLITLVDNARVRVGPFQEKLTHIEKDRCEYTFDEEDKRVQDVILNREPSVHDSAVLKKSLSCSYNMSFKKALEKESEKLQLELQRSQTNMDRGQCEMIQHLLEVTGRVAEYTPEKNTKNVELNYSYSSNEKEQQAEEIPHGYHGKTYDPGISRGGSSMSSTHDLISNRESEQHEEWSTDLLGCCSEPSLCMKTFCCPCATFARVSSVATNRPISSSEACNDLMAYSLILSCCCYTCCIRRKLRKMFNITGGFCDDFLSHLMCCCCALVQEWREVEIRGYDGDHNTKTTPPSLQYMES